MTAVIKRRFNSDLTTDFSSAVKFAVVENFIQLFDYWFVDIRDFTFFIPGYMENAAKMNIKTISFDALGTALFSSRNIPIYLFGYYSVDFSQAEETRHNIWTSNTFTGLLSNLGGYSTVLSGFFGMLLANYQSFIFDKSMLKKLYF